MINVYHRKIGDMWCGAAIGNEKVWATTFATTEKGCVQDLLGSLPYNKPFTLEVKPSPLAEKIFDTMESMLTGKNASWEFNLEWTHRSKYAQKVLGCLAKVPVGYVTTYKELAKTAGGGPRAVGQIMASNPFPPLIPCHRVIKADFTIGGFGGSKRHTGSKRALLRLEDRGFEKPSKVKTECGVLKLFPVGFLRTD